MQFLRLIMIGLGLLAAGTAAAQDQTSPAAPPGMTQQQFDALVDAISKSVAARLAAEGMTAAAPGPAAPPSQASKTKPGKAPDKALIIKTPLQDAPDPVATFLRDS